MSFRFVDFLYNALHRDGLVQFILSRVKLHLKVQGVYMMDESPMFPSFFYELSNGLLFVSALCILMNNPIGKRCCESDVRGEKDRAIMDF
jgi:hypothetical protein